MCFLWTINNGGAIFLQRSQSLKFYYYGNRFLSIVFLNNKKKSLIPTLKAVYKNYFLEVHIKLKLGHGMVYK